MKCSFCGQNTPDSWRPLHFTVDGGITGAVRVEPPAPAVASDVRLDSMHCANDECRQLVIRVHEDSVIAGAVTNREEWKWTWLARPRLARRRIDALVPEPFSTDYREAAVTVRSRYAPSPQRRLAGKMARLAETLSVNPPEPTRTSAKGYAVCPGAPPLALLLPPPLPSLGSSGASEVSVPGLVFNGKGDTMVSRSVHKLVRNQLLFREVNERIRETIGSDGAMSEFLCECSNQDCIDTFVLDLGDYERIRSDPNLFVVAPGHERLEVDRVVDQGHGYVLVEKTAEVSHVIATDPRSPEGRPDGPSGTDA